MIALSATLSSPPRILLSTLQLRRFWTAQSLGAVGDLHGDLVQTMRVLQVAGLMAAPVLGEPAQWVGGDATLVQMGDILDRGDDEIGILRLLWQLAEGAQEAGGAVYILNGNHETLNVAGDFRCALRASPAVAARSHSLDVHQVAPTVMPCTMSERTTERLPRATQGPGVPSEPQESTRCILSVYSRPLTHGCVWCLLFLCAGGVGACDEQIRDTCSVPRVSHRGAWHGRLRQSGGELHHAGTRAFGALLARSAAGAQAGAEPHGAAGERHGVRTWRPAARARCAAPNTRFP